MDIRQVSLDLKWNGVGFLDLVILFLRVVWECNCNIKHQLMLETSYLVMETHANSTPVQVYATCMCLPKRKAKEHGHYQKILPRRLTTIWQRTAIGKTYFQTNAQELSTPTCPPQTTPEQHKECVNQKHTVSHNSCPKFYPATLEENPKNNNDIYCGLFWKTCNGKKCMNFCTLDLGWDDIERHLLELLKPETYINLQR